jgi:hypothetical protein
MEIVKSNNNNKWYKQIIKNIYKQITIIINVIMSNNKCCLICCNNKINDIIKCKQCKNNTCNICFANIIYNNENFNDDYMDNKSYYNVHSVIMITYIILK